MFTAWAVQERRVLHGHIAACHILEIIFHVDGSSIDAGHKRVLIHQVDVAMVSHFKVGFLHLNFLVHARNQMAVAIGVARN